MDNNGRPPILLSSTRFFQLTGEAHAESPDNMDAKLQVKRKLLPMMSGCNLLPQISHTANVLPANERSW